MKRVTQKKKIDMVPENHREAYRMEYQSFFGYE